MTYSTIYVAGRFIEIYPDTIVKSNKAAIAQIVADGVSDRYLAFIQLVLDRPIEFTWGEIESNAVAIAQGSGMLPEEFLEMLLDACAVRVLGRAVLTNFTLTPLEALQIQSEQIQWYCGQNPQIADRIASAVAEASDLTGFINMSHPIGMAEINRAIPRGGAIEAIITKIKAGVQ